MKKLLMLGVATAIWTLPTVGYASDDVLEVVPAPAPEAVEHVHKPVKFLKTLTDVASRREEVVLDAPVAFTSYSHDDLDTTTVENIQDLDLVSSSFRSNKLSNPFANSPLRIRGIGTITGGDSGSDSVVATYVDGVYRSRPASGFMPFFDMDNVSIIKGPQGVLYGKNSTAGVVHQQTAAPDFSHDSGYLIGSVGNFESYSVEGMGNIVVDENVALRLSGRLDETDGFFKHPTTGDRTAGERNLGLRAQIAFRPSAKLGARIIADYSEHEYAGNFGRSTSIDNRDVEGVLSSEFAQYALNSGYAGQTGGAGYWRWDVSDPNNPGQANPFNYKVAVNQIGDHQVEQFGVTGIVEAAVGETVTLKSITSYRSTDSKNLNGDWDFGPINFGSNFNSSHEIESLSQEFVVNGHSHIGGSNVQYVAGAHFFEENILMTQSASPGAQLDEFFLTRLTMPPSGFRYADPNFPMQSFQYDHDESSFGLYGQLAVELSEQFRLLGGLRWEQVDKSVAYDNLIGDSAAEYYEYALQNSAGFLLLDGGLSTAFDWRGSRTDEELSYDLTLQYKPSENLMFYGDYSQGFKAGGFNLADISAGGHPSLAPPLGFGTMIDDGRTFSPFDPRLAEFEPEFVTAYELGMRWAYSDRAHLSVTGFYADYSDLQSWSASEGISLASNQGTSETKGVEIEGVYVVNDNLALNVAATAQDANYGNDVFAAAAGRSRSLAPDLTLIIGAQYERPVSQHVDLYANAFYSHFGEMFLGDGNCIDSNEAVMPFSNCDATAPRNFHVFEEQSAYGVMTANLGLRYIGNWDASIYCKNCFSEEYYTHAFADPLLPGGAPLGNPGDPQAYGLKIKKYFQ